MSKLKEKLGEKLYNEYLELGKECKIYNELLTEISTDDLIVWIIKLHIEKNEVSEFIEKIRRRLNRV